MSFKSLFGLENTELSDSEILQRIQDAVKQKQNSLKIIDNEGKEIQINLKSFDYFECGIMDGLA